MNHASQQRRIARQGHGSDRHGEELDESLQDRVGNQGVQRLARAGAQAKLEVGPVDDQYEREADQVADEVMAGGRSGDVRERMQAKTGASLDGVRMHDDPESHRMADAIGAHAFTHGNDIHFAKGAYDPGSREGQHLIAHELTHVVQQSGGQAGGIQRKAISAAPSSIQRLWNPFKKKQSERKEMPNYYDMLKNQKQHEHWVNWNATDNWGDRMIWWIDQERGFDEAMVDVASHARQALDVLPRNDQDLEELVAIADVEQALTTGSFTRGLLDKLKSVAGKSDDPKPFFAAAVAYAQAFDRAAQRAKQMQTYLTSNGDDLNVAGGEVQRVQGLLGNPVLFAGMMHMSQGGHPGDSAGLYNDTYSQRDDVKDFYQDNQ